MISLEDSSDLSYLALEHLNEGVGLSSVRIWVSGLKVFTVLVVAVLLDNIVIFIVVLSLVSIGFVFFLLLLNIADNNLVEDDKTAHFTGLGALGNSFGGEFDDLFKVFFAADNVVVFFALKHVHDNGPAVQVVFLSVVWTEGINELTDGHLLLFGDLSTYFSLILGIVHVDLGKKLVQNLTNRSLVDMLEEHLDKIGTWREDIWNKLSAFSADENRDKFAEVSGEDWVELLVTLGSDELEESIEEHILVLWLFINLIGCCVGSLSCESSIGGCERIFFLLGISFGGGWSFCFGLLGSSGDWGFGLYFFWLSLLGIWFWGGGLGLLLWGGIYWSLLLWVFILDLGGGWDFSFDFFLGFLDDWSSSGLGLLLLSLFLLSFGWFSGGVNNWSLCGSGGCLGFLLFGSGGRGLSLSFLGWRGGGADFSFWLYGLSWRGTGLGFFSSSWNNGILCLFISGCSLGRPVFVFLLRVV